LSELTDTEHPQRHEGRMTELGQSAVKVY
jgi:hypothetical protein